MDSVADHRDVPHGVANDFDLNCMTESTNQESISGSGEPVEVRDLVIVPILICDLDEVERTQRFMVDHRRPLSPDDDREVALRYVVNVGHNTEFKSCFDRIVASTGISDHFSEVDLVFADLDPELDYYQKTQEGMPRTERGYASGPNLMFSYIAETASVGFRHTFLMELDCVPMREGWAESIFAASGAFPDAWVLGSRYHGWSWLPDYLRRHLNGNAVYRFSDTDFQRFIKEVWLPRLKESASCGYPGMAYDCLPSTLEALARGPLVPPEFRREAAAVEARFVEIPSILNLAGMEDRRDRFPTLDVIEKNFPDAAIIHAKWLSDEVFSEVNIETSIDSIDGLEETDGNQGQSSLNLCIKHVNLSEGSWAFGDRFALGSEAQFLMNVLVGADGGKDVEVKVVSTGPMDVAVRLWREKVTDGRSLFAGLIGLLFWEGHRNLKKKLKRWGRKTGMTRFLIEIKRFHSRFLFLRGRVVCREKDSKEIVLRVPVKKLRRWGGIAVEVDSLNSSPVTGRVSIRLVNPTGGEP